MAVVVAVVEFSVGPQRSDSHSGSPPLSKCHMMYELKGEYILRALCFGLSDPAAVTSDGLLGRGAVKCLRESRVSGSSSSGPPSHRDILEKQ